MTKKEALQEFNDKYAALIKSHDKHPESVRHCIKELPNGEKAPCFILDSVLDLIAMTAGLIDSIDSIE